MRIRKKDSPARVPDPVVGSRDPMRWFTEPGFTPLPAWGGVRPESVGQERETRVPMYPSTPAWFQAMRLVPGSTTDTGARDLVESRDACAALPPYLVQSVAAAMRG